MTGSADHHPRHARPTARPAHAAPRPRGRAASRALLSVMLLAAVAASAAASAGLAEPPRSDMELQLDAEIDGMVESGVPADSPKVDMLEEQRDALAAGAGAPSRREPGVDTGARLAEAEAVTEAQADAEAAGADGARSRPQPASGDGALVEWGEGRRWESGAVECEPVPGILAAAEVAGATCVSAPQPDGTSRYVVVAPDGTVRSVRFGTDGAVERLGDTALGARAPHGTVVAVTPEGDVEVTAPGRAPATIAVP